MALVAWNRELGTAQGRLAPQSYVPSSGTFAFVLGHDLPGLAQKLAVGDHVEVRQTASFGDTKLVRVRARMRGASSVPAGLAWRASLRIDGAERAGAVLEPGRTRDRIDLAANVSRLTGDHELAFRLDLVAV